MTIHENHVRNRGVAPIAQSEEQWPSNQARSVETSSTSVVVPENAGIEPHTAAIPFSLSDIPELSRIRFWDKVSVREGACWEWSGCLNSRGYGCFGFNKRNYLAHRVAVVLAGRELHDDLTVDHLCRNKRCVNPEHLDLVSGAENSSRFAATITECRHGHPLSGDNVRVDKRGKRACLACNRAWNKRWRDTQKCGLKPLAKAQSRKPPARPAP